MKIIIQKLLLELTKKYLSAKMIGKNFLNNILGQHYNPSTPI